MKHPRDMSVVLMINIVDEGVIEVSMEERVAIKTLTAVMMNFDGDNIEYYEETVNALSGMGSYYYAPKKLDWDLKSTPTHLSKTSIEEPPVLELKVLPSHR